MLANARTTYHAPSSKGIPSRATTTRLIETDIAMTSTVSQTVATTRPPDPQRRRRFRNGESEREAHEACRVQKRPHRSAFGADALSDCRD
jgi:hypothetical protein